MTDTSHRDHPVVACAHGADSSGAVQLGAQLADAVAERLVLVSAYRSEPSPLEPVRAGGAAARIARAERLVPPGLRVEERPVATGRISEGIVGVAREVDACLLVLGRDLDGQVTRSVLHDAPCPVAISPFSVPLPQPEPLRRIGVAYDGSAAARCAVAAAVTLAHSAGSEVEAVVVDGDRVAGFDPELLAEDVSAAVPPLRLRRVIGDPVRALVDVTAEYDLMVCGSRGRGSVAAAVLGSVSSQLVRAARCPVIVVPPGTRPRPSGPLGLTTAAA